MGLLDGLLGSALGGLMGGGQTGAQGQNPMIQMALQVLQQQGGIEGLLGKMQQSGMGEQAQSWIGKGENMPIPADALSSIFGQGQLGQIAQQMGMSPQDAAGGLAQVLPGLVDQMTPDGSIPANSNDLVSQVLASLSKGGGRA